MVVADGGGLRRSTLDRRPRCGRPREARPPSRPEPAAPRRGAGARPRARPLTVTVLIGLWVAVARRGCPPRADLAGRPCGGLGQARRAAAPRLARAGLVLAGLAAGRWPSACGRSPPWARHLQIAAAVLGLLACPFTLASATVLLYLTRPEVKEAFEGGRRGARGPGAGSAEPTFAALAPRDAGPRPGLATAARGGVARPGLLR